MTRKRKAPTTPMGRQREFIRKYVEEHPEAKIRYETCPTCGASVTEGNLPAHRFMQHERKSASNRMEHLQ